MDVQLRAHHSWLILEGRRHTTVWLPPRCSFVLDSLTVATMKALTGSKKISAASRRQGVREPAIVHLRICRSSRPGLDLPESKPARRGMPLQASTGKEDCC